eukprot:gene1216-1535_t
MVLYLDNTNTTRSFTGVQKYDNLVIAFFIIRIIFLFILFVLNATQSFFEARSLWRRKKSLNPRNLTFFSITLYPLLRVIALITALATTNIDFGSGYWFISIWGTFFIFTEWIFIGCFWTRLLYTFFVSNAIILKNNKRAWYSSWALAGLIFIWSITISILAAKRPDKARNVYTKGFIAFVAGTGFIVAANGFLLVQYMRSHKKKIPKLQSTINKTVKLGLALVALVVAMIIRDIIYSALKVPSDSNYRYISSTVTAFLEYLQCVVVMIALGGNTCYNYFYFKRVNENSSSSLQNFSSSSGDGNNANCNNSSNGLSVNVNNNVHFTTEISLNEISVDSSIDSSSIKGKNDKYFSLSLKRGLSLSLFTKKESQSQLINSNISNISNNSNNNNNNNNDQQTKPEFIISIDESPPQSSTEPQTLNVDDIVVVEEENNNSNNNNNNNNNDDFIYDNNLESEITTLKTKPFDYNLYSTDKSITIETRLHVLSSKCENNLFKVALTFNNHTIYTETIKCVSKLDTKKKQQQQHTTPSSPSPVPTTNIEPHSSPAIVPVSTNELEQKSPKVKKTIITTSNTSSSLNIKKKNLELAKSIRKLKLAHRKDKNLISLLYQQNKMMISQLNSITNVVNNLVSCHNAIPSFELPTYSPSSPISSTPSSPIMLNHQSLENCGASNIYLDSHFPSVDPSILESLTTESSPGSTTNQVCYSLPSDCSTNTGAYNQINADFPSDSEMSSSQQADEHFYSHNQVIYHSSVEEETPSLENNHYYNNQINKMPPTYCNGQNNNNFIINNNNNNNFISNNNNNNQIQLNSYSPNISFSDIDINLLGQQQEISSGMSSVPQTQQQQTTMYQTVDSQQQPISNFLLSF